MNPNYLLIGLHIGDRLAPTVRPLVAKHGKRLIREGYWQLEERLGPTASRLAYRRWVKSLPSEGEAR